MRGIPWALHPPPFLPPSLPCTSHPHSPADDRLQRTTLYEGTARDRRYGHLQGLLDQHKVNKTMLEQRKQAGLQTKKQTWGKYGWI